MGAPASLLFKLQQCLGQRQALNNCQWLSNHFHLYLPNEDWSDLPEVPIPGNCRASVSMNSDFWDVYPHEATWNSGLLRSHNSCIMCGSILNHTPQLGPCSPLLTTSLLALSPIFILALCLGLKLWPSLFSIMVLISFPTSLTLISKVLATPGLSWLSTPPL